MPDKIIYSKKIIKTKSFARIIIKNGVKYTISITANKKHKFKKIKQFKTKKWLIQNVLLHKLDIVNKNEILEIKTRNQKENEAYDKCFQMILDQEYNLQLTNKQYTSFKKFVDTTGLPLNTPFYMQRKGLGLKTKIEFSRFITSTTGKQIKTNKS